METLPTRDKLLHYLSDLSLRVAPEKDVRGKTVYDAAGKALGHVHDLVVDHDASRILFVEVEGRGLFAHRKYLIPVEDLCVSQKSLRVRGDGPASDFEPWICPEIVASQTAGASSPAP